MMPQGIDMSKMEPIDYEVLSSGDPKQRLKLADGSVIEIQFVLGGVLSGANDPGTGMPVYLVQTSPVVRLVRMGDGTKKAPLRPPTSPPPAGMHG